MGQENLTRGERFKDSRTVFNQYGKQTMRDVSAATGIVPSIIQALETDENDRGVSYAAVAILAKHYGVSTDYLLGLSNVPDQNKDIDTLNKEIGFSSSAANKLFQLSPAERKFLCDLLEAEDALKEIAFSYELMKQNAIYEKQLQTASALPEYNKWRNDLEYMKFTLSRRFLKFVEKE